MGIDIVDVEHNEELPVLALSASVYTGFLMSSFTSLCAVRTGSATLMSVARNALGRSKRFSTLKDAILTIVFPLYICSAATFGRAIQHLRRIPPVAAITHGPSVRGA
jgi:hypothetical protein